jgi:large subunit ribosomal protein L25
MEQTKLKAQRRTAIGKKPARRERQAGRLPAVIYGHGQAPEAISLNAHDALLELQHGARVLDVELDGQASQFLIKDVQYDHLGTHPIHLDLMRVDLSEKVRIKIGIELRGTPAGIVEGGVLDHPVQEIEVECLVTQIPEKISAGVKHLKVGDVLLAKDLELPPGVVLVTDPEERIAAVRVLAEEAPAAVEVGEEPAQPEVIGRGKEEAPEEG